MAATRSTRTRSSARGRTSCGGFSAQCGSTTRYRPLSSVVVSCGGDCFAERIGQLAEERGDVRNCAVHVAGVFAHRFVCADSRSTSRTTLRSPRLMGQELEHIRRGNFHRVLPGHREARLQIEGHRPHRVRAAPPHEFPELVRRVSAWLSRLLLTARSPHERSLVTCGNPLARLDTCLSARVVVSMRTGGVAGG